MNKTTWIWLPLLLSTTLVGGCRRSAPPAATPVQQEQRGAEILRELASLPLEQRREYTAQHSAEIREHIFSNPRMEYVDEFNRLMSNP